MSRVAEIAAGRTQRNEQPFSDYLEGRTVAVVGPAPLDDADLKGIAQHDVVYYVGTAEAHDLDVNIRFANRLAMADFRRRKVDPDRYDWIVTKSATHDLPNARKAIAPPNVNLNQLPIALWDLTKFAPADVSVYGADLYLAGPGKVYSPRYLVAPPHKEYNGIASHQPPLQHEHVRRIREQTGWFDRSPRFAQICDLDADAYWKQLRAVWVPAVHGVAA